MSAAYGNWGSGYVTDVPYVPGYYRQQSPLHLRLTCLLGGVAVPPLKPDGPLSYLELGCGQGLGAALLAAANPGWRVTAIDFSPAHIAAARELAAEAGIGNITYLEADLTTLAGSPAAAAIAEVDVASLHGLWSWVGDPVRAGTARLLGDKVKPGGIVYVSYNALPGWQSALGMQRLLLEAGHRVLAPSDRQAAAGFELVRELTKAKAHHLLATQEMQSMIENRRVQASYLAHEYMNADWRPCFHADVVAALGAAKFEWVGPAHLLEYFQQLMLSEEARAIVARYDEPIMRELVKDMFLSRSLRQDVFVRGARRLGAAERNAALGEVMLALLCAPEQFVWDLDVPEGRAGMARDFYGPIVAALQRGPQRVRDLLVLPDLPRRDNPVELVGMLVGSGQALPVSGPAREPESTVRALNRAAARRFVGRDNLNAAIALASSGTGAPVPCQGVDLAVADRLQSGEAFDAKAIARGLAPDAPDSEHDRVAALIDRRAAEGAPIWRRLGVLGAADAAPSDA